MRSQVDYASQLTQLKTFHSFYHFTAAHTVRTCHIFFLVALNSTRLARREKITRSGASQCAHEYCIMAFRKYRVFFKFNFFGTTSIFIDDIGYGKREKC